MPILKYAIANVDPKELAEYAQTEGLSGSVTTGYGFGAWGIEPTVSVEMAVEEYEVEDADKFVRKVLFKHSEEAAYRTVDGKEAGLLHVTGVLDSITSNETTNGR